MPLLRADDRGKVEFLLVVRARAGGPPGEARSGQRTQTAALLVGLGCGDRWGGAADRGAFPVFTMNSFLKLKTGKAIS